MEDVDPPSVSLRVWFLLADRLWSSGVACLGSGFTLQTVCRSLFRPAAWARSGLSSPSEAGAPFLNAAGYAYTGVTPARPGSAAAARGRAEGLPPCHDTPTPRRPASAGGPAAPPRRAAPAGSGAGLGSGWGAESPASGGGDGDGGASALSSAEYPRSFQLLRSGSSDSLASLVRAPPRPAACAAAQRPHPQRVP